MGELIPSDGVVKTIRKNLSEAGVKLPLKIEDIDLLFDYFRDVEETLASELSEGKEIDMEELDAAADFNTEFTFLHDDGVFVNLDELNRRLMAETSKIRRFTNLFPIRSRQILLSRSLALFRDYLRFLGHSLCYNSVT